TYPHVEDKIERLEYAISDNPLGPFKVTGVIMDESPTGCWTNHQSIIEFKNQWYLFYHHNDYSPNFDKARSIRADYLNFNDDGTIQKVIPTLRGVGITKATSKIELDRYSAIREQGTSIAFIDTLNAFKGWKTVFNQPNAWVQYNNVDFDNKRLKSVRIMAKSESGGTLEIRTNGTNGPVIAEVKIPKSSDWTEVKVPLKKFEPNHQNLIAISKANTTIETDWIKFE